MKKSGAYLTMIAVVMMLTSIGLAGLLSMLTPEFSAAADDGGGSSVSESQDDNNTPPTPEPVKGGLPGGNSSAVIQGRLPGFENKEINSSPDVLFCYLLNSDVTLESPDAMANIMAENDPGNVSPMQVCYYLEGNDELIYTSAMAYPGEYIGEDKLSVKLKKGKYKVNAVISVYDENTMELKTTFHQEVTLTINKRFLGLF